MPPRLCIALAATDGIGGPHSFVRRLTRAWEERGIEVTSALGARPLDGVLVISATKRLGALLRCRREGIRVVQRLNGINWIHTVGGGKLRHRVRAEVLNGAMRLIRDTLADAVVYQSEFSRRWWSDWYGPTPVPEDVVHNGVDLAGFSPRGNGYESKAGVRLLMVEANIRAGYEVGLESAAALRGAIQGRLGNPTQLIVVGAVDPDVRMAFPEPLISWMGCRPPEEIPFFNRGAHLFFSADINASCSNSTIEAMACGVPVVGYDTGALSELLVPDGGVLVPYGGDPWRLQRAGHTDVLADAAVGILGAGEAAREAARRQAEIHFDIRHVARRYAEILLELWGRG